jgi:alkylation response protein AidB-like acyl-CoA dehydrogenase
MQLDFTSDQDELRSSVRAVLEREWPIASVRALVETGDRAGTTALWKTMVSLDWPGLAIAEADGGVGLGFIELGVLAEELGRVVAGGPLLATISQYAPAVREAGGSLAAVASGEGTGTLAVAEHGRWDVDAVATEARPVGGDRYTLHGTKTHVFEAPFVDTIAVVARTGDRTGLFAIAPGDATIDPLTAVDGSRSLATVELDGTPATAIGEPTDRLGRALEEAAIALALEMVGTAQTIFDITLEYAKHRFQFGVPIGSFQAVKHKLANMMVAIERARATCYFAAATIAEDDPRRALAASMAKAAAGDAQRLVGQDGIQLLGGIGYTWEHDMHLYVKRVRSSEPLFGNAAFHRAKVADHLGL